MGCDRIETDGMRYLDQEMTPDERAEYERHLRSCSSCRESIRQMENLGKITSSVRIKDPQDAFWDEYWKPIFRRTERKTGWVLILAGGVMVILYALYRIIRNFGELTFDKFAVILLFTGFIMLFVSVLRERLHQRKSDRYKDVKR